MHNIYTQLLSHLELSDQHKASLTKRGFTDQAIKLCGFKTMPMRRKDLVQTLLETISEDDLGKCAGFYKDNGKWALAGCSGIIIPVRSIDNQITGLKIRSDRPLNSSSKYVLLSTNPRTSKSGEVKYPEGTAATISNHHSMWGKDKCKENILRIAEGEFKAELATKYTGIYTVSISGVSNWRMAMDAIKEHKPKTILLSFDADKDKPNPYTDSDGANDPSQEDLSMVGVALAKLYCSIRDQHIGNPIIEDWPMCAGKGIDDVLIDGNMDVITQMSDKKAEEFCSEMLMPNQPKGWVYVVSTKRFHNVETMIEYDKEQYSDEFAHLVERGTASKDAISNPQFKKYPQLAYDPKQQLVYIDKDNQQPTYNLYRPSKLIPKEGDVTTLLEHFDYLFVTEYERNIVLDYIAYNVQKKGHKILWMLIIRGHQGTGKSYIGDILVNLLGQHNVSMPSNDEIHEIYTGWLKSSHLIIIEELMARGRLELMNKLKPIITQGVVQIREMHKPAYKMKNVANLIAFTNYDDSIIVDKDDRRYCMVYSDVKPKPTAYYKTLWDWTRNNYEAMLYYFLDRDISTFNPNGHAPMTEGKRIAISATKLPIDEYIDEGVENREWPFINDILAVSDLSEVIKRRFNKTLTSHAIGRKLKELGAVQFPAQLTLSTGSKRRLWALRDVDKYMKLYELDRKKIAEQYEDGISDGNLEETNILMESQPL